MLRRHSQHIYTYLYVRPDIIYIYVARHCISDAIGTSSTDCGMTQLPTRSPRAACRVSVCTSGRGSPLPGHPPARSRRAPTSPQRLALAASTSRLATARGSRKQRGATEGQEMVSSRCRYAVLETIKPLQVFHAHPRNVMGRRKGG